LIRARADDFSSFHHKIVIRAQVISALIWEKLKIVDNVKRILSVKRALLLMTFIDFNRKKDKTGCIQNRDFRG